MGCSANTSRVHLYDRVAHRSPSGGSRIASNRNEKGRTNALLLKQPIRPLRPEKLPFPAPAAHRHRLRECLLMRIQPLAHLHRLRHHRDCEQVRVLIHQHAPARIDDIDLSPFTAGMK
jgi:hypothetical protein